MTATNVFGANGLVWRNSFSGTVFYAFDERGNVSLRVGSGGAVLSSDGLEETADLKGSRWQSPPKRPGGRSLARARRTKRA